VARVVVEVSKGSGPVIGEMVALWALLVGEHANLPDGLGGVGGRWSQDRAWREIDGRATKGKRMLIVDVEANRSLDEGKGRPIDSRR
jgi:hypothetical protein